jgi:hypothetical protein
VVSGEVGIGTFASVETGNWIGDCTTLTDLIAPEKALQSLTSLNLSGNSQGGFNIVALAAASLTSGALSAEVTLEEGKSIYITELVGTTTVLDLSGHGFGDASAHFIRGLLRSNRTLTSLCFDHN